MVITQLSASVLEELRQLLEQMNACALMLEEIGKQEREAIHLLDSDHILQLTDKRIATHQQLAQLEAACHNLLKRQQIDAEMTLEMVIDMYGGSQASEFQAIRRKLYERILQVDRSSQENRLRLLAAYNVTSTILQKLGLSQSESTYSRSTVK